MDYTFVVPIALLLGLVAFLIFISAARQMFFAWLQHRESLLKNNDALTRVETLRNTVATLVTAEESRSVELAQLTDEISKINDRIGPMQLAIGLKNQARKP